MRHRVEHVGDHAGHPQRHRRGDDRAVAVLHPITATPGHVVAEERVVPGLELRILAEHGALLSDDLLGAGDVLVDFGLARVVMDRDPDRGLLAIAATDLERPDRLRAQLRRAVHQVLQVRRGERPGIVGREQLRRRHPRQALRRLEGDAHAAVIEPARPQQRRRHVHVRVRRIDGEIGAVDVIAVDLVDDADGAVVTGDVPLVRARPCGGERLALAVERLQLEHVLRVFVQRVSSRRRPAHARLERARGQVRKRDLDLRIVVFGRRERDAIRDRRLRRAQATLDAERDETGQNRRHEPGRKTHGCPLERQEKFDRSTVLARRGSRGSCDSRDADLADSRGSRDADLADPQGADCDGLTLCEMFHIIRWPSQPSSSAGTNGDL